MMRICFVCPNSADLFTEAGPLPKDASGLPSGRAVGGAERQLHLIGRELARRGHRVTFVVRARPGLAACPFRLVALDLRANLPRGLGRVVNTPRLWRGLAEADPDCLIQRGADPNTLDMALFARACRRRFVFMAAHDDDFLLRTLHTDRLRNLLYRRGVKLADAVVVQTERQKRLARERFRRSAVVVPNPVEVPAGIPPPGDEVLWIGTLRPEKRPEALLDLARALPRVRFTAVGGPPPAGSPGEAAARAFLREAARLPNLSCAGAQPPSRMDAFYARAALLVNTSSGEGFPNALLEAWARGRPVVTAGVDPDEVICRHGLGIHARDAGAMAGALSALLADPERRHQMGEAARRYVETHHAVGPVVDRFEALLRRLGETARPCRPRI